MHRFKQKEVANLENLFTDVINSYLLMFDNCLKGASSKYPQNLTKILSDHLGQVVDRQNEEPFKLWNFTFVAKPKKGVVSYS